MRFLLIFLVLLVAGCSDKDGVKSYLEEQGYKNVVTESGNIFACSQDDYYSTKFYAKSPTGYDVHGVVCSGFVGAMTIKFYH